MQSDGDDTNLLFGILAVKLDFINRDELIEAMGAWFLDRRRTLGEVLVDRGACRGRTASSSTR